MSANMPLLQIEGLTLAHKDIDLVQDISFSIERGQTLALVGESGSGKSLTAQAILGLFTASSIYIKSGKILFEGEDLTQKSSRDMRALRGQEIAFISQNPMSALNPTLTIGFQLVETMKAPKEEATARAQEMLKLVGMSDVHARIRAYPHELSGGMKQRVLIAMSLMNHPKLLIADEPTTALDVTIQAEILDLLVSLQKKLGMALLFITHDLGIVAQIATQVAVMYSGQIVEIGSLNDIFYSPLHPYTQGLLAAIPRFDQAHSNQLLAIDGSPPVAGSMHGKCPFVTRCPKAMVICSKKAPPRTCFEDRYASCWNLSEKEFSL